MGSRTAFLSARVINILLWNGVLGLFLVYALVSAMHTKQIKQKKKVEIVSVEITDTITIEKEIPIITERIVEVIKRDTIYKTIESSTTGISDECCEKAASLSGRFAKLESTIIGLENQLAKNKSEVAALNKELVTCNKKLKEKDKITEERIARYTKAISTMYNIDIDIKDLK